MIKHRTDYNDYINYFKIRHFAKPMNYRISLGFSEEKLKCIRYKRFVSSHIEHVLQWSLAKDIIKLFSNSCHLKGDKMHRKLK
jgi:hypothetical protein